MQGGSDDSSPAPARLALRAKLKESLLGLNVRVIALYADQLAVALCTQTLCIKRVSVLEPYLCASSSLVPWAMELVIARFGTLRFACSRVNPPPPLLLRDIHVSTRWGARIARQCALGCP